MIRTSSFFKGSLGKSHGMSLIEMVVALGISSILIYSFASQSVIMDKQLTMVQTKLEQTALQASLQAILRDSNLCMYNMTANNTQIPTSIGTTTTIDINSLKLYDSHGNAVAGSDIFPNNIPNSKLDILSAKLKNIKTIVAAGAGLEGYYIADFEISAQPKSAINGFSLQPVLIPNLRLITDSAGKVKRCLFRQNTCVSGFIGPKDGYSGALVSTGGEYGVTFNKVFSKINSGTQYGLKCSDPDYVLSGCSQSGLQGSGGLPPRFTIQEATYSNACFVEKSQNPAAGDQTAVTGLYVSCCSNRL